MPHGVTVSGLLSLKRMATRSIYLGFLALQCFSSTVLADTVVLIGNHNVRSASGKVDDRPFQRTDLCRSIESALSMGHQVRLFAPTLVCTGSDRKDKKTITFEGECPNKNGCSVNDLKKMFGSLGRELPRGKNQNLLIQTIGHGGKANPFSFNEKDPEFNDLVIQENPQTQITAAEFSDVLNKSGVLDKVRSVKGLISQCYGGGWNELARLVKPVGRFCSLSQTRHDLEAVNVEEETKILLGSVFTQGFWEKQIHDKGKASLSEAGLSSGALMRRVVKSDPFSTDWRTSSIYLAEKFTQTGPFGPKSSDRSLLKPPNAYFSDGLDTFRENPLLSAFLEGVSEVSKETDGVRDRYKKHVSDVSQYNKDRWFFQDSKTVSSSYVLRNSVCSSTLGGGVTSSINNLGTQIREIQTALDQKDFGVNEESIRKQMNSFLSEIDANRNQVDLEIKKYWTKRNNLLNKSGELMRKIKTKGLNPVEYEKLQKEYTSLDSQFKSQESLTEFPFLLDYVLMAKKVHGLKKMLDLMESSAIGEDRDILLAAWACENEPVFQTSKSK